MPNLPELMGDPGLYTDVLEPFVLFWSRIVVVIGMGGGPMRL